VADAAADPDFTAVAFALNVSGAPTLRRAVCAVPDTVATTTRARVTQDAVRTEPPTD